MTQPDTARRRADEEQAARERAVEDALRDQETRMPPGHGAIEYFITLSLATRMLPHVRADVAHGRWSPPGDWREQQVYAALHAGLQRPAPQANTGETIELDRSAGTPRQTRRCPDCQGQLEPIRLIEQGQFRQQDLEYARVGAQASFSSGIIPTDGRIEPYMCDACGRILLYGQPSRRV